MDAFTFEVIKELTYNGVKGHIIEVELLYWEKYYMDLYNSITAGYNVENTWHKVYAGDKPLSSWTGIPLTHLRHIMEDIERNNGSYSKKQEKMSDEEAIALGIEELKGSYKDYEQEEEYISLYKAMGHFNIYNKALTSFLIERGVIDDNKVIVKKQIERAGLINKYNEDYNNYSLLVTKKFVIAFVEMLLGQDYIIKYDLFTNTYIEKIKKEYNRKNK